MISTNNNIHLCYQKGFTNYYDFKNNDDTFKYDLRVKIINDKMITLKSGQHDPLMSAMLRRWHNKRAMVALYHSLKYYMSYISLC